MTSDPPHRRHRLRRRPPAARAAAARAATCAASCATRAAPRCPAAPRSSQGDVLAGARPRTRRSTASTSPTTSSTRWAAAATAASPQRDRAGADELRARRARRRRRARRLPRRPGAAATSEHLRSREEVAEILAARGARRSSTRARRWSSAPAARRSRSCATSSSACPRWSARAGSTRAPSRSRIGDVVARAGRARPSRDDAAGEVQLGGADVLTYREMMRRSPPWPGRRAPLVVRVPVLTPRLSSYWVALVTPVDVGVARPLVDGLSAEMVVRAPPPAGHQRRADGLRRRGAGGLAEDAGRLLAVPAAAIVAAVAALLVAAVVGLRKVFVQALPEWLRIVRDVDDTTEIDARPAPCARSRPPRSSCPPSGSTRLWAPQHLERLARTYWRFLTRVTLGAHPRLLHRGRALRRACSSGRSCS